MERHKIVAAVVGSCRQTLKDEALYISICHGAMVLRVKSIPSEIPASLLRPGDRLPHPLA